MSELKLVYHKESFLWSIGIIMHKFGANTHTTEEEKLVKMFLTLLDFTNRFTVSILSSVPNKAGPPTRDG